MFAARQPAIRGSGSAGSFDPFGTKGDVVTLSHFNLTVASVGFLMVTVPISGAADFDIRDGDTVVFLGDSITAARVYGKLIENFTLLRYPERKVHFINAGKGGETAAGALKRFERDVLARKPTLVTIAYGVNDIGWGTRADEEHKRAYLEGIRGMVEACKKRGVRVYVCSAAVTAEDPAKSEHGFLQQMCDEGMKLSRSLGGKSIDVQRTMREIQKRMAAANATAGAKQEKATLHVADGVHLNDVGQLAMAYAILKGLGASPDVSAAAIDAGTPKVISEDGCKISDLKKKGDSIEFVRLDSGLPLNNGIFFQLQFRFVPIPDELNRYLLTVSNLPSGDFEVLADGRSTGHFSAENLARGVNLSSSTSDPWEPGGPWNAQANILQALTEARNQLGTGMNFANAYLKGDAFPPALDEESAAANKQIEEMQRSVAKPKPYHFMVRPYVPPPPKK
jgi:lysophospholipase L1-like esterase